MQRELPDVRQRIGEQALNDLVDLAGKRALRCKRHVERGQPVEEPRDLSVPIVAATRRPFATTGPWRHPRA
jgi:hypothetical protein